VLADFARQLADWALQLAFAAAAEEECGILFSEGVETAVGADSLT